MCMRTPKTPAPSPTPAAAVKPAESAKPLDIAEAGLDSEGNARKKRGKKKLRKDLTAPSVNVSTSKTGLNISKG